MKVHMFLVILFGVISCMLCDVSHLFSTSSTTSTTQSPTTKDSLDSISIITKQELNDNSDLLKNNVEYKPYSFSKMMMELIDFIEINRLSEPVNRNSLKRNERTKYYYNKPKIPFDSEDGSQEEVDYSTLTPKTDEKPIKLETFNGYDYPKPLNPMTYPERSTTEIYDEFPGASARIITNLDGV